jgi:hypothetical protein
LAAQKVFWQNTFEVFWISKTLSKVFFGKTLLNLSVGPVHPYRRETISTHTEKLSRNRRLQENMESRQNLCFVVPSVLPPLSPHQSSIIVAPISERK